MRPSEGGPRAAPAKNSVKRALTTVDGRMFGGCLAEAPSDQPHRNQRLQAGIGGENPSLHGHRKRKSSQLKVYDEGIDVDSQRGGSSDSSSTTMAPQSFLRNVLPSAFQMQ